MSIDQSAIQKAQTQLDSHVREIVVLAFLTAKTGLPTGSTGRKKNFDPRKGGNSVADLIAQNTATRTFPYLRYCNLRSGAREVQGGARFNIFETGYADRMPKQDSHTAAEESTSLAIKSRGNRERTFSAPGAAWLMVGPTGTAAALPGRVDIGELRGELLLLLLTSTRAR